MLNKLRAYITRSNEINIILFKILGMGGISVSFLTGFYSLFVGEYQNSVLNFSAAVLAFFLLYFVEKTGRYTIGYIITQVGVFMGLFTLLFRNSNGVDGALPFFMVFSLIFTFLMYRGRLLFFMVLLLGLYYSALCSYGFYHPEFVYPITGNRLLFEKLIGILGASLPMGFTFLQYIKAYEKQKTIAEEANKAKSLFLANMSHEIRTPINAILGFNEVILRTTSEPKTGEYASYVDQSGHHLLEVINGILDFSRIDSGKEKLILDTADLKNLITNLRNYMSITAQQKNLDFVIEYDTHIEHMVQTDIEKLQRILTNLLSNAFKYTENGTVTLRLHLISRSEDRQTVRFEVQDTGIGIRKEDLPTLFQSYERVDLLTNQKIQGTGLGLAISNQLAYLLGSNIQVESTYGTGSRFFFDLVLSLSPENLPKNASVADNRHFIAPSANILVVDDDAMNRALFDTFLKTLQIHADLAVDGPDCLEKAEQKRYDLILMDYMMPDMDGAQTMELIRSKEYSLGIHTPIVVLTADVVDHVDRKLLERGFDEYLSKPVDFQLMEQVIERRLPAEKVFYQENLTPSETDLLKIDSLGQILLKYDIQILEGLKYVNQDLTQYLQIAEFFVKNSSSALTGIRIAMEEEDPDKLRLAFHSLKGNSGSLGAVNLYKFAQLLESKCKEMDLEFVSCAFDLLLLQWKRAVEGLQLVLKTEGSPVREEVSPWEAYSFEDLLEELKCHIDCFDMTSTKRVLEQLKKRTTDNSFSSALDEITQLTESMEFELAMEKVNLLTETKGL